MGKSPAFQFYPKDYMADEHVQLMSLAQEGAYLRLLCHQFLEGSVPEDIPALARICRVSKGMMERLWPGVRPCFPVQIAEGRIGNRRMLRDRADHEAFIGGRSAAGKKGAEARWGNGSATDLPKAKNSPPASRLQPPDSVSVLRSPTDLPAVGRVKLESEALRLAGEIAGHVRFVLGAVKLWPDQPDGADASHVMREATAYKGRGGVVNPASCRSDERLQHAVIRLREWLHKLNQAGESGEAGPHRPMPWERYEEPGS